jgi:hypothetical protein
VRGQEALVCIGTCRNRHTHYTVSTALSRLPSIGIEMAMRSNYLSWQFASWECETREVWAREVSVSIIIDRLVRHAEQ